MRLNNKKLTVKNIYFNITEIMKIKTILLTALASILMFSCEKDVQTNNSDGQSYSAISIKVASSRSSRATETGTVDEQKISKLGLVVFSKGLVEKTSVVAVDATSGSITASITTTAGLKTFVAITNPNENFVNPVQGTKYEDFCKTITDAANVTTAGSLMMIGNTNATVTPDHSDESTPLEVQINVSRISAKVVMKFASEVETGGLIVSVNDINVGEVTHKDASFILAQKHLTSYLSRDVIALTPSGEQVGQSDGNLDHTFDHLEGLEVFRNSPFLQSTVDFSAIANSSTYCAENINEVPFAGNVTYALIRLKVTPKYYAGQVAIPSGSFWVIKMADGTFFDGAFQDIYPANQMVGSDKVLFSGAVVLEYTNGYSYYRLPLRDQTVTAEPGETDIDVMRKKYSVLANHVYKVNITTVNGLGSSTIDETVTVDPEAPAETQGFISATLVVEPWTVIDMNEPLG